MSPGILPAGQLRHLVTIQQHNGDQDPVTLEPLQDESCWSTVAENIFAEVETLSGRDTAQLQQAGYTASHRISLRWYPGIEHKRTRFLFCGIPFYVIHPNNVGGWNSSLICFCQTGAVVQ